MIFPRLKDLREDKDLVQKEVAAYLGIDQRVYVIMKPASGSFPHGL